MRCVLVLTLLGCDDAASPDTLGAVRFEQIADADTSRVGQFEVEREVLPLTNAYRTTVRVPASADEGIGWSAGFSGGPSDVENVLLGFVMLEVPAYGVRTTSALDPACCGPNATVQRGTLPLAAKTGTARVDSVDVHVTLFALSDGEAPSGTLHLDLTGHAIVFVPVIDHVVPLQPALHVRGEDLDWRNGPHEHAFSVHLDGDDRYLPLSAERARYDPNNPSCALPRRICRRRWAEADRRCLEATAHRLPSIVHRPRDGADRPQLGLIGLTQLESAREKNAA